MFKQGCQFIAASDSTAAQVTHPIAGVEGSSTAGEIDFGLQNWARLETVDILANMMHSAGGVKTITQRYEQVAAKARAIFIAEQLNEMPDSIRYEGSLIGEMGWELTSKTNLDPEQQKDMAKVAKLLGWSKPVTRGRAKVWTWKEVRSDNRVKNTWIEDNDGEPQYWVELVVGLTFDEVGGASCRPEAKVSHHLETLNNGGVFGVEA